MPTEKPRVTFTINKEKLEELERFQHENRIKNQTQAVLALIEKGLSGYEVEPKSHAHTDEVVPIELSKGEQAHIKKYRLLDPYGKEAVDGVLDVESRRCEAARANALREQREQMEVGEMLEPDNVFYITNWFPLMPMSAGTGQTAGSDEPEELELKKRPPRGTSYIAPVSGDSMEPTYQDGDKLFIRSCKNIEVGQVGVFLMDGQQWVKELGNGVLISHNDKYAPIPMRDDIECQGLVLGVCDESYFECSTAGER